MAHPARTDRISVRNALNYERRMNGIIVVQSSSTSVGRVTADIAAASTNNPKRLDGTRAPSNWRRAGGVMSGAFGSTSYSYKVGTTLYEDRWHGLLASPGLVPGSIPYINSQGELEAIRQALGRFGEAHVQLGAALREAQQTAGMVKKYYDHANTLTSKLNKAVNGNKAVRQQFRDFLRNGWKDVPSAYLEYLFGMKPLADDLTNAVQVLQDTKQHDGSFNMALRGTWRGSDEKSEPLYSSLVSPVTQVYGDYSVKQISRAVLYFRLPDWYWDRLPPVTPFREGWETARLSFVLDWVLPVNSWLAGFEGNQLRPFFREGSRSTFMRRFVLGNTRPVPAQPWSGESAGGSDYAYQRTAFFQFPTGELFSLPRFRNILGLNQLRVGSALLGQKLAQLARGIGRP